MNGDKHSNGQQVLMAVFLYATVLIYQGYTYGIGDQSQILPCLYALDHPGFYLNDYYVSSYLAAGVNERTVFHFLFHYLGYNSPIMMLIWHAVISIAMIMAWLRIAAYGIKGKAFQYLAVAAILTLGFHTSVGGNELYYNSVIPSLLAKALASWAICFWIEGKYRYWIVGLVLATFIQPLVGVQVYLLTAMALLLCRLIEKAPRIIPWKWIIGYVVLIGPWFYLLMRDNGGQAYPDLFMEIMAFRLSHHFFPATFGVFHWILFAVFAIIAVSFYKHRLRYVMWMILLGCLVYVIGVEWMNKPLILYSQWFKTTIWLEAFAMLAIFVGIEKLLKKLERYSKYWTIVPVMVLILIGTYRLSGWFGPQPSYMIFDVQEQSDEVQISGLARDLTEENAVFIVPIEFSAFRWYSKRSLYIDYKALYHNEIFLKSWYNRIQNIYAYSKEEKDAGFEIESFSYELLSNPTEVSIEYWKSLGVTHIVSPNKQIEGLTMLGKTVGYGIYRL